MNRHVSSERQRALDEVRRGNDHHRHWVPLLVIACLLLLTYLWTDWMGRFPVPGVEALAKHPVLGLGVTDDGHLESRIWVHPGISEMGGYNEIAILCVLTGLGFLLSYYLPLRYKKPPLVVLTFIGVGCVFGAQVLAMMLAWHLAAFAAFHRPIPEDPRTLAGIALFAFCACLAGTADPSDHLTDFLFGVGLTTVVLSLVYGFCLYPILQTRAITWIQGLTAHASLVYIAVAFIWNTADGANTFPHSLGLIVFFFQWERLVMYQIDLKDGHVPHDLSLFGYLATFFSPAFLANPSWINRVPKGYAYMTDSFLARDKNVIVLSGLKLISLSVLVFYLAPLILCAIQLGTKAFHLPPLTTYDHLVFAFHQGFTPGVASVWIVLVYSFLNFYLLWTGVAHLRVGLWRLFGYDIAPYFQKPFLSTNLVEFWKRYSYYYKEFLVQAFYYPVFQRFFKKRPYVRVVVATMAAACFGNFLFHLMAASLKGGSVPSVWMAQLRTLPYYVVLGLAIGGTQIWLLRRGRGRRRPWTGGWRIALDVVAVVETIGFFVLIRPFHHVPVEHSITDALRIVVAAFGLEL